MRRERWIACWIGPSGTLYAVPGGCGACPCAPTTWGLRRRFRANSAPPSLPAQTAKAPRLAGIVWRRRSSGLDPWSSRRCWRRTLAGAALLQPGGVPGSEARDHPASFWRTRLPPAVRSAASRGLRRLRSPDSARRQLLRAPSRAQNWSAASLARPALSSAAPRRLAHRMSTNRAPCRGGDLDAGSGLGNR